MTVDTFNKVIVQLKQDGLIKKEFSKTFQEFQAYVLDKSRQDARKYGRCLVLDDVEIFKIGTWNGDKYTEKDLDQLVENFEALKGSVKPPVKLGHGEGQKLLKQEGMPAAGWITSLKRVGDTLYARIADVPKVIADLVKRKAYRRVSAEIYPVYKDGVSNKLYRNVLRAIAFLGGDIPAVETLQDITGLYSVEQDQDYKLYSLDLPVYKFTVMAPRGRESGNGIRIVVSR